MIIIYEFFGMEYEFEVPQAMVEKEVIEHFASAYKIPFESANKILEDFDLMEEYELTIDENDIRYELTEKCENMALEECIDGREYAMDKDYYYGVNRND